MTGEEKSGVACGNWIERGTGSRCVPICSPRLSPLLTPLAYPASPISLLAVSATPASSLLGTPDSPSNASATSAPAAAPSAPGPPAALLASPSAATPNSTTPSGPAPVDRWLAALDMAQRQTLAWALDAALRKHPVHTVLPYGAVAGGPAAEGAQQTLVGGLPAWLKCGPQQVRPPVGGIFR